MIEGFVVRRRPKRHHPMRTRRIGGLAAAGAAGGAIEFPGSDMPEPDAGGRRWISSGLSLLGHGVMIALLLFLASRIVEEEEFPVMDFVPIEDIVESEEPAAAPQVLAEKYAIFDPAPMALAPQVVNTAVIQKLSPTLQATQIDAAVVAPTVAPVEVAHRSISVDRISRVASDASAVIAPVVPSYQGPALAGPIQYQAPVGIVSGPRQVVRTGSTVGTGGPNSFGSGGSVRDGIASNRDVFGADSGIIADPRVAVGNAGKAGLGGGNGSGSGNLSFDDCLARPEVQAYLAQVRDRTISRWILPSGLADSKATLRFRIDPAGSASHVNFQGEATSAAAAKSAVEALLAASPFSHMGPQVRCLANHNLVGTFSNTLAN